MINGPFRISSMALILLSRVKTIKIKILIMKLIYFSKMNFQVDISVQSSGRGHPYKTSKEACVRRACESL